MCSEASLCAQAAKVAKNFNLKLSILTNYFFRCYEPNVHTPILTDSQTHTHIYINIQFYIYVL